MDPFLGEIRMFAGTFAPNDWLFCNGQLLPISRYTALFSLLGTMYGGDGKSNFALPNLQGRAPMNFGAGPGLTQRYVGEEGGSNSVTLQITEMPAHTHLPSCSSTNKGTESPEGAVWGATKGIPGPQTYANTATTAMNPLAIAPEGASQPHNNMQPYTAVNFIICMNGIFPQRP